MRFVVLGPVQGEASGRVVNLGSRQQRLIAAVLALSANRPVATDRLVDLLWPVRPPASALGIVRGHVSLLRRVLRAVDGDGARIDRAGPGYVLCCDPQAVDAHRFRLLVAEARAAGDDERRARLLDDALGLWRGPAMAGTSGEEVRARLCADLDEARIGATEDRAEALLRLGRHLDLVEDLAPLAGDHPDRARLSGALMLALHRSGRTPEALTAYQRTRAYLAEELGLDPPQALQELHGAILRDDPDLTSTPPGPHLVPGPVPGPAVVPRQLPADTAAFTGRTTELDHLLALPTGPEPEVVVISAIDGMAGIGKTTLAVHAAHRLAGRYPDGQLFLDLHGHTEGIAPTDPAAALETLLRSIGMDGVRIPASTEERAALYRTRLAGRRMLIVLDNASTEGQVRPLLPGGPDCLVLVTSRRRLAGLDDTEPVSLDVLPVADAVTLFTRTVGESQVADAEPALLREIVELCGRLPLAIRIAAARLRHRPTWTLDGLARLLRDGHDPLAALRAGERSVAASVHLSYHHLTTGQQRMFRLLGLHPGRDTDVHAAAALAGCAGAQAVEALEDLCDSHLLDQPAPGRYRMHDLVRAHATQLAQAETSAQDRTVALTRLLDHYARTATEATRSLHPHESGLPTVPLPRTTPAPGGNDPDQPARWLDDELGNLLAAASHAALHGWPAHAIALSAALRPHLETLARYADGETLYRHALGAARDSGDPRGELVALTSLGRNHYRQGQYEQAGGYYQRALHAARDTGDRTGEHLALTGLGSIHQMRSEHDQADQLLELSLRIAGDIGHRSGEIEALLGLGGSLLTQGRLVEAADRFERALRTAATIGHRHSELAALIGLGRVRNNQGHRGQAIASLERALRLAGDLRDRGREVDALLGLGYINRTQGEYERAIDRFERVLGIATALGQRNAELIALNGLGAVLCLQRRNEEAARYYERALRTARDIAVPHGEVIATLGLADTHRLRGRYARAIVHYQRALSTCEELGERNCQFEALLGLGHTHHATGRYDQAVDDHLAALRLAESLAQPEDELRAHDGLADTYRSRGQADRASHHWRCALDILTGLGLTRVEHITVEGIRAQLAEAPASRTGSRTGPAEGPITPPPG